MSVKNGNTSLDQTHAAEANVPERQYQQWPNGWHLFSILKRNKATFITSFCLVFAFGLVLLRLWPKQYASVALVATKPKESANPLQKWGDPNFSTIEQSKYAIDDFKSALFSYDVVSVAANETGMINNKNSSEVGVIQKLKTNFWEILGGEFSQDEKALQRQFFDILRYKKISIENMGTGLSKGQNDLNLIKITNLHANPATAQAFLQRLLEQYKQKLEKEDFASSKNMVEFYDEQINYFSKLMADNSGDSSATRKQLQTLDSKKDELKRKLQEETDLHTNIELQMSRLRQDMLDADAKYSDKHPLNIKAHEQYKESSGRLYGPLYKVRKEIESIKKELDIQFQALINVSGSTYESSGTSGEGHTEYFTKKRTELRGISKVYETMQERYLQALVQNKLDDHSAASRFEIIEAASTPLRPYSPSLTPGLLVVGLGSLLAALLAAIIAEFRYPKARDRWLVSLRSHLPLWGEQSLVTTTLIEQNPTSLFAQPKLGLQTQQKINSTNSILLDSLSYLIAKVSCYNKSSLFQCGFFSLADSNIHTQIVYNMAITLSDANFGAYKVLIISDNHIGSLLSGIDSSVKGKTNNERFYEISPMLGLFDSSGLALNENLSDKACNLGYNAILWDLPECNALMWRGINIPLMPLVGVVESDNNTYANIIKTAKNLDIMVTQKNFPIGIYLTSMQESVVDTNSLLWGKKAA